MTQSVDEIKIDLSGAKNRDLILFEKFKTGSASQEMLLEFLDRVVVGGASELPLTTFRPIIEAVAKELELLGNPKDGQGKA